MTAEPDKLDVNVPTQETFIGKRSASAKARLLDAQRAIGQRVRRLRLKKGWSQEEFADRCAIDRSHMSAIERGETNMAFSTLYTLTYYLDITIYELLRGII